MLQRALGLVDFNQVHFDQAAVAFARPGMALSFNGIAQGYITDRITEMLREAGLTRALEDMGEIRALNTQDDAVWQAGIRNPDNEETVVLKVPSGRLIIGCRCGCHWLKLPTTLTGANG